MQFLPVSSVKKRYLEIIAEQAVEALNQKRGLYRYSFKTYSYGWIIEIKKVWADTLITIKQLRIWGYHFPLNEASVAEICTDKAACALILSEYQIPSVPHTLFIRPSLTAYTPIGGIFSALLNHANTLGYPLVAKVKNGSGGTGVFFISSSRDLEKAAISIFSNNNDICLCPYYDIVEEYRVIILEGEVQLCFSKQRPFLIGDGKQTIAALLGQFLNYKCDKLLNHLQSYDLSKELTTVLDQGEKFYLNWKHNLGQGSTSQPIEKNETVFALAIQAAAAIGLRFGSVDIVKIQQPAVDYRVLEINAGVMVENFIAHHTKDGWGYQKGFEIYKKAIQSYFEDL